MMMRKINVLLVFLASVSSLLAQGEGVEPMAGNPQLQKAADSKSWRSGSGTFDSTFIYTTDTISLPVFDEFSKSKFQTYAANYTDPGVTFDKVYRLLDLANNPLPNDVAYTTQQTFRRIFDIGNGTSTDDNFPATQIKVGDLSAYPVAHVTTDVYPPYYIYDTLDFPNDPDTIWLTDPGIIQDSATQFFAPVNNPELIWLDHYAYHNYSMAKDPWSLGVATFDGLDENGFPYAIGSTITNYADFLTSKPIDLSGVSAGDSLYLSFLVQKEGLCDPPEAMDSLVLEFYAKDLDQWKWVWSTNGGTVSDFSHEHILIDHPDYFKKGFQFRFKNYGGLSGSLDHFHLDYVNLRTLSGYQDTVVRDFAFVYPIYSLLETFTSVPWDHYKNNPIGKMSSNVQVVVRNSDNVPENEQDGSTSIYYNGALEGNFVLMESLLNNGDLNYSPMTTYYSFHDFSGGSRFDETKTGLTETFEIVSAATHQNSNFTQNDSTTSVHYFQNYYSYDDGTAEQAYGPTGVQSRLAIKYTPWEADSIIGAYIHFVPTVNDVSDNLFLLTVWDDNGGAPGNVIYEDDVFFPRTPSYEYDRNIFTTYYFKDTMKVAVNGTFYIGWRQFESERLGVGFDRNIVNNDKTFYSTDFGNSWNQSTIPGSVMIRPIFSTSFDVSLGIEKKEVPKTPINVYPNPTQSKVFIEMHGEEFKGAELFNLQGQSVANSSIPEMDVSNLPAGIYFLKLNGRSEIHKISKK